MPAEDVTINANWTVNQYTIRFEESDGKLISEVKANYGSGVTAPVNPQKEGYTFDGWNTTVPETMPAENMTIVANRSLKSYDVTFKDGNTTLDTKSFAYGTSINPIADPVKE
jgi:uncharacterized repeat protein (TIGR02543 family)